MNKRLDGALILSHLASTYFKPTHFLRDGTCLPESTALLTNGLPIAEENGTMKNVVARIGAIALLVLALQLMNAT